MNFLKTIIAFSLVLSLKQLKAQTGNNDEAFTSYIQQGGKDENFTERLDGNTGDGIFTWQIDNGQVYSVSNGELNGNTRYRGFIPGIGSFIDVNYNEFYLYNHKKLIKIKELPQFQAT